MGFNSGVGILVLIEFYIGMLLWGWNISFKEFYNGI